MNGVNVEGGREKWVSSFDIVSVLLLFFFFQAEDGIRDKGM